VDHSQIPVLEALEAFRRRGDIVYGPPGDKQGRGVDPRVLAVLGEQAFTADVLMLNGLDDRRLSKGVLPAAEELMADAVRADKPFSRPVAAMLAVAGPGDELIIGRNCHKNLIAGLILSGSVPSGYIQAGIRSWK
jgi:arginine/lysine/ornithine decarboxylase